MKFGRYLFVFLLACCKPAKEKAVVQPVQEPPLAAAPEFNGDSAYAFVKAQCDFGPRVPGTKAHETCAQWLVRQLREYSDTVHVQNGRVTAFNGARLDITNIVARFNPSATRRILLFAHWDTRPWADRDSVRTGDPILGADDAGSGVGVLLELARGLSVHAPPLGIDLALFDAEDYGTRPGDPVFEDSYALGTQYWCRNRLPAGYTADYGILLDLVGARGARFSLEGNSRRYAPGVLDNVWNTAGRLGYGNYFVFLEGGFIEDDHVYVNELAGIPSIDIIHTDPSTGTGFPPYWHTHGDNMDIIDRETLKAVGQTLLEVIFVSPGI